MWQLGVLAIIWETTHPQREMWISEMVLCSCIGPVSAISGALKKAGLSLKDMDLVEVWSVLPSTEDSQLPQPPQLCFSVLYQHD